MNKNKELFKNTIIITVGKICTQFMSFFLLPLYTAVLTTEEYGTVDLVITYTSLLMPIILFQVDQALFRFLIDVRGNKKGQKEIISTASIFAFLQIIIVLIIFFLLQSFLHETYKYFLLCNVIFSICSNMMLQASRGLGDNISYAMGSFISAATQIVGNILLLIVFPMGVYGMLIATIFGNIIASIFIFIRKKIYRYIELTYFSFHTLKGILQYSIPLIPNALCWWVLNASDRTIVLMFLGSGANGLLSVGHKFSSFFISFYNIFNLSWTESAAVHQHDSDRDEFFSGVITNMFKLFMCAAIAIIAIMPFVFPIIIDEKFAGAFGLIPIFMLATMFNVVIGLYSVIYVALLKTKEIAKTSIYSGILNIVIHLVLVKFIGLYAAPISSAVAFGIMAIYRCYDLKKYINIKLHIKWILLVAILYVTTCYAYYSYIKSIQVVMLLIVVITSVLINKGMITNLKKMILGKLKMNKYR